MTSKTRFEGLTRGIRCARTAALLAVLAAGLPAAAQTTNDWLLSPAAAGGNWTNTLNWTGGLVPDSNTEVAIFTNNYTANFAVTQDVNLAILGMIFDDTGADPDAILSVNRNGSATLTFDGADPFIESRSTTGGGAGINLNGPVLLGANGLRKTGNGAVNFAGTLSGSSTVTVSGGYAEIRANNSAFYGAIIVSNATLDVRSADNNALGTNNVGTTLYGSGQIRLRDLSNRTFNESVTVNGFNAHGAVKCYASSNVTFNGPVLLNTNAVFSLEQWLIPIDPGRKQDWYLNSVISDDGNGRGAHFLNDFQSNNSTGVISRTSEIVLGGASTYGGYSHVTAWGPFNGTVRLTNGSDRLPTGTTLYLGGFTNGVGLAQGSGRLILNGYDQTLAGLRTLGVGPSNAVFGSSPNLSTLTLNVGAGTNNLFGGTIGGTGPNENNLALVSRGAGVLNLTGSNTYTGTTTVTNGTLLVNGSHIGGGAYAVKNGGILGGTGTISGGASFILDDGAILAPGNSPGTLTLDGNLTFSSNSVLSFELRAADRTTGGGINDLIAGVNDLYLDGILNVAALDSFGSLATNDYWTIITYDGLLLTNLLEISSASQLLLSGGLEFAIDDSFSGEIRLTVIPEPSAFSLLALGLAVAVSLAGARLRRRS